MIKYATFSQYHFAKNTGDESNAAIALRYLLNLVPTEDIDAVTVLVDELAALADEAENGLRALWADNTALVTRMRAFETLEHARR